MFKKVFVIGVSVGPLRPRILKLMLNVVSLCANKIYVRDNDSFVYFNKSKTFLIPDLSLGAKVKSLPQHSNGFRVSVSLMDVSKSQSYEINTSYLKKVEEFIKNLNKTVRNLHVDFIAMDYKKDLGVINEMQEKLTKNSIECNVVVLENFELLDEVFGRSDFILATRLHSAILAVLYEKPFMVISYQQKVKSYFYSHGLEKVVLEIDDLDLIEKFKEEMSNNKQREYLCNLCRVSKRKLLDISEEL